MGNESEDKDRLPKWLANFLDNPLKKLDPIRFLIEKSKQDIKGIAYLGAMFIILAVFIGIVLHFLFPKHDDDTYGFIINAFWTLVFAVLSYTFTANIFRILKERR